jgi:hypothetical protein
VGGYGDHKLLAINRGSSGLGLGSYNGDFELCAAAIGKPIFCQVRDRGQAKLEAHRVSSVLNSSGVLNRDQDQLPFREQHPAPG